MNHKTIRVLLIEDDSNYAQLVQAMLFQSKSVLFDQDWSDCLSKGLDRLAAGDIDVILLDLNLPDSGGFDTFVRTRVQVQDVPIIVLTGIDDVELAVKAVQMGAQDYLIKGQVNSNHLIRSILYAIERHRARMKQQRQDLHPSEAYFRNIIERNADGIIIVDEKGVVRYVNPAAQVLFDRSAEELIGEVFDSPLAAGEKTQINISHKTRETVVVEMRMAKIKWEGETAYLASLRDITDHKKTEESLRNLSLTDDLTGLYNRRGFLNLAQHHIKLANLTRKELILILTDLDDLKKINDNFGHQEGDMALLEVGNILNETFRKSDVVARFGGDEFVVLAMDVTGDSAQAVTDRLQKNIQARNSMGGRRYELSLSTGVACYDPNSPCSVEELLARADESMYLNKRK